MYVKFKYLPYFMILFRYDRDIGIDIWKLNLPQTPLNWVMEIYF